jgi:hypothetical protein
MITAIVIAAGMCLQGGEQEDVSRYVVPTASGLELKVTLRPANGGPFEFNIEVMSLEGVD